MAHAILLHNHILAVTKVKSGQAESKVPTEVDRIEIKDHLFVTVQKKRVKVSFSEILFIESQREYIRIVTVKKELVSKMSTNEIESLLPQHLFKRVHRSFIVSLNKIESYTADEVEVNGVSIPVGRDYKHVLDLLK